jgi:hypothetical protein
MIARFKGAHMIFGKPLSEYVRFERVFLILIVVVGLARLVASLAGMPNTTVRFLSITVIGLVGIVYYGIRVHTTGFGSYKQLLPLIVIQNVVTHILIIAAIVLARLTHHVNIYSAPEYGGNAGARFHILGHLLIGMVGFSLVGWLLASIVMWVTKRVSGKGRVQPATA